jgi:hypothetical protein
VNDTPNTPDPDKAHELVIPEWMIELGYEPGDDIADFDGFVCDVCHEVWDVEDSTCRDVDGEQVWLCPRHAGLGY